MLNLKIFDEGLLGANTFLVWEENSLEGMIIDCGNHTREVKLFAESKGISVKYIVLTHGHYDHAEYTKEYVSAFAGAMLVAHRMEKAVLSDSEANVSALFGSANVYPFPDLELEEGETLSLGEGDTHAEFVCIHTPGHTPGSICLYCEAEKIMFTGDTLFNMGFGRTDFKHGDAQALSVSLKRLTEMDGDIEFYAGHGGKAKLGAQKFFIDLYGMY